MKQKYNNRVFKIVYQMVRLFFIFHLLFFIFNIFLNYSIPFDGKSEFTIRGHVSLIEKNWNPIEVTNLNEDSKPIFLLYKTGFVRFDFNNWKNALTNNSILYIFFYNLWLLMGLFITFQFYRIFKSIIKERVFRKENSNRLRLVAITIIIMPIIQNVAQRYFLLFARANLAVSNNNISLQQEHSFYGFPYLPNLIVGLLILAVVAIYNEGMRLQSESELMI